MLKPLRPFTLVWSALWRAEAAHLAIFAAVPGIVALARLAGGIAVLPALLAGPGDRAEAYPRGLDHLRDRNCWVALLPCPAADLTVLDFDEQPRRPVFEPPAVEPEPFLPVPTSFTARHLWFAVWLAWFLAFIGLRERSRRR